MLSQMNMEIEAILDELETERSKFTKADKAKMRQLVDQLVELGVYRTTPAMERHGYTPFTMMEGWGARWFVFRGMLTCPNCGANWRDTENGPPFKRQIGLIENDRLVAWRCPDCRMEFPVSRVSSSN